MKLRTEKRRKKQRNKRTEVAGSGIGGGDRKELPVRLKKKRSNQKEIK